MKKQNGTSIWLSPKVKKRLKKRKRKGETFDEILVRLMRTR